MSFLCSGGHSATDRASNSSSAVTVVRIGSVAGLAGMAAAVVAFGVAAVIPSMIGGRNLFLSGFLALTTTGTVSTANHTGFGAGCILMVDHAVGVMAQGFALSCTADGAGLGSGAGSILPIVITQFAGDGLGVRILQTLEDAGCLIGSSAIGLAVTCGGGQDCGVEDLRGLGMTIGALGTDGAGDGNGIGLAILADAHNRICIAVALGCRFFRLRVATSAGQSLYTWFSAGCSVGCLNKAMAALCALPGANNGLIQRDSIAAGRGVFGIGFKELIGIAFHQVIAIINGLVGPALFHGDQTAVGAVQLSLQGEYGTAGNRSIDQAHNFLLVFRTNRQIQGVRAVHNHGTGAVGLHQTAEGAGNCHGAVHNQVAGAAHARSL